MRFQKGIIIGVIVLSMSGCNFFEWLTPPMSGISAEELIYRGEQYFEKQDYTSAEESFYQAMLIDPKSSKARLGYARALLWQVIYPVANIVAEEAHKNGDNIYQGLLASLNKNEFKEALFGGEVPLYQKIIDALEGPNGIIGNQGDGVITDDKLEPNVILLVAYFSLISLNLLDSNGDRQFLTPPDYLRLQGNEVTFSLDIDRIVSNVVASTEIDTSYTADDLINTLKGSHDALEESLSLLRFLYLNIVYVDGLLGCVIRPSAFLKRVSASSSAYSNQYDEIRDALTNPSASTSYTNSLQILYILRYAPTNVGRVLNDLHHVLVGSYAYQNLGDFTPSVWGSHSGGLKAFGETLSGTLTEDDVSNVITQITNEYTPEEISNIIAGLRL
ncbi:tetratricopeptide repeat protein [Thermospira aquatica]|uniref:Tetratricopeptide repeat protein n=1 Tax=Thermospira aquatica TaxID=2828656 RepID=A0AAX3BBN3_9SPIR|nr:hypothetical protein [Thermospira aquatica]URA09536.1 hypothetical protein KDW03_08560 [Thermospira aquatica]